MGLERSTLRFSAGCGVVVLVQMRLPGGVELSCISALRWTGRNRGPRGETRNVGLMRGGEKGWRNQAARTGGLWWRNSGSTAINLRLFPPGPSWTAALGSTDIEAETALGRGLVGGEYCGTCIGGEMRAIGPVDEAGPTLKLLFGPGCRWTTLEDLVVIP